MDAARHFFHTISGVTVLTDCVMVKEEELVDYLLEEDCEWDSDEAETAAGDWEG